jgi:cation diffusion facilitator CzcD-associated flavoprotein CzcO
MTMSSTEIETQDTDAGGETLEVGIAIVGSGFSGLGMAIRLKQEGNDDFVVLERDSEVGGTWWANTYPGCACDVPSHLYSFSFAPNPDWPETYSTQPEIGAYLRRCADEFGIRPHVRLNTNVTEAAWNEDEQRWEIETSTGTVHARFVIAGVGPLAEPKIPDIPGLDSFEGATFHSARWNHDHDLKGEKVASIGTGASAIQLVPAIQPDVEKLHVFQRTAPWIFPHNGRPITKAERRLYRRFPILQKLVRAGVYVGREGAVLGFVKNPKILKAVEKLAEAHRRKGIGDDPELLDKVRPDYSMGCKRILPSNRWYPTLTKDNVELVTSPIKEVKPRSIVTEDGAEHEVDTIIFSTGFHVSDMPVGNYVRGRDGRSLAETWDGSAQAYLGATVHNFPNMFLLLGPNTGLGHNSMVYMIESQIAHVLAALHELETRGASTIEVRREVQERFNDEVQENMVGTVWESGCSSWYKDEHGRNVTLWPDWTWKFRRRLRSFDPTDYTIETAPLRERVAVAA